MGSQIPAKEVSRFAIKVAMMTGMSERMNAGYPINIEMSIFYK